MDKILFLPYSMLNDFAEVDSSSLLYSLCDKPPELNRFCFQRDCPPLKFTTLSGSVAKALNALRSHLPQVGVAGNNESKNVVMRRTRRQRYQPFMGVGRCIFLRLDVLNTNSI